MHRLLIFIALAGLTACSTPYQKGSLTGGYYEIPVTERLQKVVFSGNGYTTAETVSVYALRRCAEIAKEQGKSHFVMFDSLEDAAVGRATTTPSIGMIGGKPHAIAFLLLLEGPRDGGFETEAALREVEGKIKQIEDEARKEYEALTKEAGK